MQVLIAYVIELLGLASTILGIVQFIQGMVASLAQERKPHAIEDNTQTILDNLNSGLFGLSHIAQSILDARDAVNAHTDAALDGLTVTATIPDQPSWYTPPPAMVDPNDIAYAVWSWQSTMQQLSGYGNTLLMSQCLEIVAARELVSQAWFGIPLPERQYFAMVPGYTDVYGPSGWSWGSLNTSAWPPLPDWTQWQDGDTPLSFLSRTQPSYGWVGTGPSGVLGTTTAWKQFGSGLFRYYIRSNFSEMDIARLSVTLPPLLTTDVDVPPLWLGAANETELTPVALTNDLHIAETMDGVKVHVTTPPDKTGRKSIGGETYDYGVGLIAFGNDQGYIEPWQYLGFRTAIFTPKTMKQASHAYFQVLAGAGGTVTPFIRS